MNQAEYSVSRFLRDIRKTHAHPWTKCVLIGFGAHPSDAPFCRQPLTWTLGQRKLHGELSSDSQWRKALYKEPSSADSTCSTLELSTFRGGVFDPYRERDTGFGASFTRLLGFSIGENLIDEKIPGQASHGFAIEPDQGNHLLGGVNFERFALVSAAGYNWEFHTRRPWAITSGASIFPQVYRTELSCRQKPDFRIGGGREAERKRAWDVKTREPKPPLDRQLTGFKKDERLGAFHVLVLLKDTNRSMLAADSVFGDDNFLNLFLRRGVIHHVEHGLLKYRA